MNRLQRFAYRASVLGLVAVGAAIVEGAVRPPEPARSARDIYVTVGKVASQLGIGITMGANDEFAVGVQFTGSLEDPMKLAQFGVVMRKGARVLAARVGPDRVLVDADELDPPRRATAKLQLTEDGTLVVAPKAVAAAVK